MKKYIELTKLFRNLRKKQIGLFFVCLLSIVLNLLFIYQIQEFVDMVTQLEEWNAIIRMFLIICAIGGLSLVVGIIENRKWHTFRYTLINQMRCMMYNRLLTRSAAFYDARTTGDMVSAIMNDGSIIAESAGIDVLMLLLNVFQVVAITAILIVKAPVMGIAACAVGAVYFLAVNRVNKRMRSTYKEFSQENANLNHHLTEDIKAVLEIKALSATGFFEKRYHNRVWDKYFAKAKKLIGIDVTAYALNTFISVIFPVVMTLLGGVFLYKGEISIGVVILFYTYSQRLIEPLNNLADFYRGTQIAIGAAERVYEYLQEDTEDKQMPLPDADETELEISIEQFAWGERSVLHSIHEKYHGGDCIFIEGESGAGKTTLLKLLCGFYKVTDGFVAINGKDVYTMSESERFRWIKIQFQEPVILEGTLRDNIVLGENYSDEEVVRVLEMGGLKDFVREYGLDYKVAEAGNNMSGGQKQRLALARVLIRKPKILILDEATNGMDAGTEQLVLENIRQFVAENNSILFVTSHKEAPRQICNKRIALNQR